MPIEHLSLVTAAIKDLIAQAFDPAAVTTTAASPQDVKGPIGSFVSIISVSLFHLVEDGSFKNQPAPKTGSGQVPVRQTAMGLNLYYVINAHNFAPDSDTSSNQRALEEQNLLGIVAKVLHDNPLLTIKEADVTVPSGDRVEIILRPVSIEETIQFWSSDETHLARPSLYVEARVVFVAPEPPETLPSPVLSVNSPVFLGFGPQLTTSRSTLAFVVPTVGLRALRAEPARVALFATGQSFPEPELLNNNLLTIEGVGFGQGSHFLELTRKGNTVRLALDHAPPAGPSWVQSFGSTKIVLSIWTLIFDERTHASVPLLPGTYTARFIHDTPPLPRTSNEIAFAVVPQITSVEPDSPNVYVISVSGNYLAQSDIQLVVGTELLVPGSSDPPTTGNYVVRTVGSGPSSSTVIAFFDDTPVDSAHPLPVNLIVNGVNATPAWLTVTGP